MSYVRTEQSDMENFITIDLFLRVTSHGNLVFWQSRY